MTRRLLTLLVPLGVSLLLAFVGPAGAATVTVSTANDSGAGSLRASIAAALPGDTISFDPILNGQTITLTGGEIAITKAVIINGPGAASLSISGNRTSRIFNINAPTTISGLTLTNGQTTGDGGALIASANVTLSADTLSNNHSGDNGGAAASRFAAAFVISDCTFSNNTSDFLSGALYTDGKGNSIVRSQFLNNSVLNEGVGGAIFNDGTLSIGQSAISNNSALGESSVAGGIYSDGAVTITDSSLSGNSADAGGQGGAFYNAGIVTFRNSTISGNHSGDATANFDSQGGGVFNEIRATVSIVNSTLANNTVGIAGQGGGIYNNGTLALSNSTIAGNASGMAGSGGGIFSHAAPVAVANTIIARNAAPAGADVYGPLQSQGFNLIGDTTGSTGEVGTDLINIDPKLGPLQNNGGNTLTMALGFGSPAIDQGDAGFSPAAFIPPLLNDQRGSPRVINGRVDIGAFEADVAHLPLIDSLKAAQQLEATSHQGAQANVGATFSDSKGHPLTVQWFLNGELKQTDQIAGTPPVTRGSASYGGFFPLGTTTIMLSVTDDQSAPVTQSTTITVLDTTAPTFSSLCVSPKLLSPPNHKMVAVKLAATVSDIADPNPKCRIVSVTSNEPGPGEFQITGDMTVNVQADRNGSGSGRIYTIAVQATDSSGNSMRKNVTVTVPKGNCH